MAMKNFRLGIDFGTTFSFVGFVRNGVTMSLVSTDYNYGIPSLFFDNGKSNGKKVGKFVENKIGGKDDKFVVSAIKRRIAETGVVLDTGNTQYTVSDIIYEIINYVANSAVQVAKENQQLDFDSDCTFEAVITVPVDFTEPQRNLIREAASRVIINGTDRHLNVIRTITEPVAAAIHYFGIKSDEDSDILVLDLGGGTFDLAWVRADSKNADMPYEVIDQDGDKKLGGNDWDKLIADYVVSEYEKEYGEEVRKSDYSVIMRASRDIKEELTSNDSSDFTPELHGNSIDVTITVQDFENMAKPLVDRYIAKIDEVMERQKGKSPDHIILTGGGSYMPMIQEAVKRRFDGMDVRIVDPAHSIAYGAARYADELESDKDSGKIQLISSHAYGIRYYYSSEHASKVRIIIPKGEKLPYSGSVKSYTRDDNWSSTTYVVYETNSSEPVDSKIDLKECREIMTIKMEYNPPAEKDSETTDTLSLSIDEILSMTSVSQKYNAKTEGKISLLERNIKE